MRHFTFIMCDVNFTAGPFTIDLHRSDPLGTAIGRFEKGLKLAQKIISSVKTMGGSNREAYMACVRVNMLLETEMDALLADEFLLRKWCSTRLDSLEK